MAVTVAALRRLAVAAQGFTPRARTATEGEVEAVVRRLSAVQIDALAVVERTQRIVIASRIGEFPHGAISSLLAAGRLFEYMAHELCLLPIDAYPLVRWRMREGPRWDGYERVLREHPDVAEHVLGRLRNEGPLLSRAFEASPVEWLPGKAAAYALAALADRGVVCVAGRPGGQRLYDLAERVIPAEILAAPEPDEGEVLRELALRAVRARGVLTEAAIREHWRLKGGRARLQPYLDALVGEGLLRELAVEDGGAPMYVDADADLGTDAGRTAALLSPFDNLLWDRPLCERLFGFSHVIEIYKRAPERRYGYYVLPLLWGDRIVGRADLKTDRKAKALRVLAFNRDRVETRRFALDEAFEKALARLAGIARRRASRELGGCFALLPGLEVGESLLCDVPQTTERLVDVRVPGVALGLSPKGLLPLHRRPPRAP